MDSPEIGQLVRDVFGNVHTELINGWVSMPCPLSPWTHEHGQDKNPSAGISVHPQGISVFSCFTCKNTMPIFGMLRKYSGYSGENLDSLIEELEQEAYLGPRSMPDWDTDRHEAAIVLEPLKEAVYMDLYDSAAGHEYIAGRGISDETAANLQLMLDPADPKDGEERILLPVFGPDKSLYGFSGRATHRGARLKVRDYYGLRKAACLLGIHLIDPKEHKYVLLAEGLFDYVNGWEQGFPTVAAMHSNLTDYQADLLRDLGLAVYMFYDDDKAGQDGVVVATRKLVDHVPVFHVAWPDIWIEDPEEPDGGHWAGDLGELLAPEIQGMIDGAVLAAGGTHEKFRSKNAKRVRRHTPQW